MKVFNRSFLVLIVFALTLSACTGLAGLGGSAGQGEEPSAVPELEQAATATLEEAVPAPENVSASTEVVHELIPGELPVERMNHAGDHDSSITAAQNRAPAGDRFTFGKFERPFSSDAMSVYFPYLDIRDTFVYQDGLWVYAEIILAGGDENNAFPGKYAFEIDLDLDGSGDFFVIANRPSLTDWSVDGVQVWSDEDGDIGGTDFVRADGSNNGGNGYETLIFDNGDGSDRDLAWVRIDPNKPNTILLAVKLSLLNGDTSYLLGVWTGTDDLNPALFDLNDHFTHEQAGTSLLEYDIFYPIKQLSELDNSCRMSIGFMPNGSEPGVCSVPGGANDDSCSLTCSPGTLLNSGNCTCYPDPNW